MHLGNGAIAPECAYLTLGAAAAGLGFAAARVRREPLDGNRLATAGALSAAVFAAQMVNVPVLPHASAHLVGGVLLAWCLGPALGSLCIAVVLLVQSLLLGDGGLMALGANTVNMALLPAGLVWLVRRVTSSPCSVWRQGLAASCAAAASVLFAAGLIVGEVSLFRGANEFWQLGPFAARMISLHAWIGLGEGLATWAAILALGTISKTANTRLGRRQLAGLVFVSLLLVVGMLPLASTLPDGYEASVEQSGLAALLESGSEFGWQSALQSSWESALAGPQLVGLAAMCLVAVLACGVTVACRARLVPAKVVKRS